MELESYYLGLEYLDIISSYQVVVGYFKLQNFVVVAEFLGLNQEEAELLSLSSLAVVVYSIFVV